MNTQLNNTPADVNMDTTNTQIMTIISGIVLEGVERDDEHKEWMASFNEALTAAKGHISREQLHTLENAPWFVAMPYGYDMFLMGLRIGRDPMSILTLPEGKNIR